MRTGIVVDVKAADRRRLAAIVADRNSPQKHVWRARIVLLTADGLGTVEIMRRTGKSKTCVWRWQERFMTAGRRAVARQDAALPRPAAGTADRRARHYPDAGRSAWRGDALDRRGDGGGGWDQRLFGAAHLASARSATASGAAVQTVHRSRLCAQAARGCRALCRSA